MANKAQIIPVEQKTMVQGQAKSLNYKPIMTNAQFAQGLSELSNGLSNAIYEQNKRIEKLKFADNDEKLKITSAEMNLALSKAKDQDEFDAIKKEYTDRMKNESKARLGKMYDKWNNLEGSNFMSAMEVDIKEKQIGLNDKIAKETATSTIKDMAYQWGYAPTEEARRVQDDVFNDYLANSGFNVAEQEAYRRKYDHDKEHGYLTQEVIKNPAKVKKLLDDPKNFDNLTIEERESFRHSADVSEKALKKARKEAYDKKMEQDLQTIRLNSVLRLDGMLDDLNQAKQTKKDGQEAYDPEKLNISNLLTAWDLATSYGTDPMKVNDKIVYNPNGETTKVFSKEEEYNYKKKMLPMMMSASRMLSNKEIGAGGDSPFSYQLKLLTKAIKERGGMDNMEIADLMRDIHRENQQYDNVYGAGWDLQPFDSFGNVSQQDSYRSKAGDDFQYAFKNYYLRKGTGAGVNIYKIPNTVKMKIMNEKEDVAYQNKLAETKERMEKLHADPFTYGYAMGTAKNIPMQGEDDDSQFVYKPRKQEQKKTMTWGV